MPSTVASSSARLGLSTGKGCRGTVLLGLLKSALQSTRAPRRYVDVGAQASGQIRKLHVEAGDDVTEGQLLVEIDPST
ncbi:biotin/lipoyl-binding protein, partial [Pseudomonas aeruginosa]